MGGSVVNSICIVFFLASPVGSGQNETALAFFDTVTLRHLSRPMKVLLASALTLLMASAALGSIATFTTRAAFNTAAPALVTEDFEEFSNPIFIGFTGPLDATTSVPPFISPGDILPRLSLADVQPGPDPFDMIASGAGDIVPGSTKTVGTNRLGDDDRLQIAIAGGVTSVGFDLYSVPQGGLLAAELVAIELFSTSNVSLGVFNVLTSSTGSVFFGAISDMDLIGRLTIYAPPPTDPDGPTSHAEFVDNISFDAPPGVPEPATWLVWTLLSATAVGQACFLRRDAKRERATSASAV